MKFVLKSLCVMGAFSFAGQAGQGEAHQSGQSFASSLVGNVTGAAKSTNPHTVPGFQTDRPQETSLNAGSLGEAAFQASRTNEAAQHIISEAKDRKSFKIDPDTDPLFVGGNEVIADPQKAMDEKFIETTGADGDDSEETKSCEEAGDETLEECEELRVVTVKEPKGLATHRVDITIYTYENASCNVITGQGVSSTPYSTFTSSNLFPNHLIDRVDHVEMLPVPMNPMNEYIKTITLSPDGTFFISRWGWSHLVLLTVSFNIFYKGLPTEEDVSETIGNNCHHWEENVEKGLCSYEDVVVIEGPQTRVINGYAVTRDWWRRKKIYRCHYPAKNDCSALRAKGCYQVNSACKEKVKDVCVVWEQTYNCPTGKRSTKSFRSTNKNNPYCLTGNCADTSYQANGEMMNVMSQLSALREVQEDLRNYKVIFRGQDRRCTRHCVGFKDCCGSEKGWGVSVHLAKCDEDEKELRKLRDKNLCVQVGTYCAEKVLGMCIRKKTSFCCYGTKMARLIQQNGRAQLGISFGAPDSPNCSGLSTDELSRIDFSRIDFSELYEDIRNMTVPKSQEQSLAQVSTQRLQENMTLLTKPSLNPQANLSNQKLKAKGF